MLLAKALQKIDQGGDARHLLEIRMGQQPEVGRHVGLGRQHANEIGRDVADEAGQHPYADPRPHRLGLVRETIGPIDDFFARATLVQPTLQIVGRTVLLPAEKK